MAFVMALLVLTHVFHRLHQARAAEVFVLAEEEGLDIFLDGFHTGLKTPALLPPMYPGTYLLTLKGDRGATCPYSVTVNPGKSWVYLERLKIERPALRLVPTKTS